MTFAKEAPHYWKKGLSAIPLLPRSKRPAVAGWQVFADRQPDREEIDAWLRNFPDGNIGLALGPSSGLIAIDVDTENPTALRTIEQILPKSPWKRVGRKGYVLVYRYNGERTARVQTNTEMIFEVLSSGTQIVLPPSIHPDTGAEYRSNTNLYDVLDQIPTLLPDTEGTLRGALIDAGVDVGTGRNFRVTNYVPSGQRNNIMTWHAGLLARAVSRGERSLMEALGEIEAWVKSYVEEVVGDPLTVEEAQKKVIYFLVRDVTGPRRLALPVGWDEGLTTEDKEKMGLNFSEEDEKWSGKRIFDQLVVDFQNHPDPHSEAQQNAIQAALGRIARSEGDVTALDSERALKFIVTQTAGILSLSSLRRELQNLKTGDIEGHNHDEIAREVHKHVSEFGELRHYAGKFWQWKGSHWEEKPENELMKTISNEFGHYPSCRKNSDYQGVLKLLRSVTEKALRTVQLRGVNFANGFLDEDLVLREHHPDFGCVYVLPYRYLPEEARNMPLLNRFMVDSWGHDPDFPDKVCAFQEAVGATLFGVAPKYQRAICLIGMAGSGKSVASQIVRALLPRGSVSSVAPEDWADRFLPAEMFGKVLNFAGELSETKKIPGEIFKQIIEGEQIVAQYKNKDPFNFKPVCAHWFNSNHLPKTSDTSDGFNRRWLFIEWNRPVPIEKRIPDLASKIAEAEREAIVAWAAQGFSRIKDQGDYTLPTSHMALTDQMSTENNSVRFFLQASPLVKVGLKKVQGEISAQELYNEYWSFCLATGVSRRVAAHTFVRMMRDLQTAFDFKVLNKKTNLGAQEVIFEGIDRV